MSKITEVTIEGAVIARRVINVGALIATAVNEGALVAPAVNEGTIRSNEVNNQVPFIPNDSWILRASRWLFFTSALTSHPMIAVCAESQFENDFLARQTSR